MARGDHQWFKKITWQDAEKIAGMRLDRRRQFYTHTEKGLKVDNSYAFNGNSKYDKKYDLFIYQEHSEECTGCSEYEDGHQLYAAGGCQECGYTGKRRQGMHFPWFKE